ncbi:hypothetical protein ACUHMQ_12775 [Chitinimonas sp. PSY-7]|uniref:hypothetical protein n=1 Tax=Chitinimonas sp. PSY-7 TaxID=3459088 RepID=UPI00403FEFDF
MAFKDAYNRLVRENRERGQSVRWVASLGWDEVRREQALCLARERGRLSAKDVAGYLVGPAVLPTALLAAPATLSKEKLAHNKRHLEGVMAILVNGQKKMAAQREQAANAERFEFETRRAAYLRQVERCQRERQAAVHQVG